MLVPQSYAAKSWLCKVLLLVLLWPGPRLISHSHDHLPQSESRLMELAFHLSQFHSDSPTQSTSESLFHFHWVFPGQQSFICGAYPFACAVHAGLSQGDDEVADAIYCQDQMTVTPLVLVAEGFQCIEAISRQKSMASMQRSQSLRDLFCLSTC